MNKFLKYLILWCLFINLSFVCAQVTIWDASEDFEISINESTELKITGLTDKTNFTMTGVNSYIVIDNDQIIKIFELAKKGLTGINDVKLRNTVTKKNLIIKREDSEAFGQRFATNQGKSLIEDALLISSNIDICSIQKLINKYKSNKISTNRYLHKYYTVDCKDSETSVTLFNKVGTIQSKNAISSPARGMEVTKYADALAKFLVKRAKEELTISFFSKLKAKLDGHDDMKVLFPKTHNLLTLIDKNIYDYKRYLSALRLSFSQDLDLITDHFPAIITNHEKYFTDKDLVKSFINNSSTIINKVRDNAHPGDIIQSFSTSDLKNDYQDIQFSIETIQLISNSLKNSTDSNIYWVDKDSIDKLINDDDVWNVFLGLLAEHAVSSKMVTNSDKLYSFLMSSNINSIKTHIKSISLDMAKIKSLIKTDDEDVNYNTQMQYVSSVSSLTRHLINIPEQIINPYQSDEAKESKNQKKVSSDLKFLIDVLEIFSNMYFNINAKKYSLGIVNVIDLYSKFRLKHINEAFLNKESNAILKFGGFMAAVSEAQDSDQLAAIIETYALPTGSARIKRESSFNVSINSFMGLYGSSEQDMSVIGKDNIFGAGVTTPIGISVSHGGVKAGAKSVDSKSGELKNVKNINKHGKSVGVLFSIIDIGAVSAFRFKNNDDAVAKIYLKEIIAPGIFFSWGLGNVPISVNAGYQRAPRLNQVNTFIDGVGVNNVNLNYEDRWLLSFAVDIPLLTVHNKE